MFCLFQPDKLCDRTKARGPVSLVLCPVLKLFCCLSLSEQGCAVFKCNNAVLEDDGALLEDDSAVLRDSSSVIKDCSAVL